ncbi:MAG: orotate phosphoribosyltransferase [Thermoproteus sp. AZ2]|jgi:orotate phosphoribosyltransferase|uniref:Orotate phosphoribosyltransferase n=1 Tax=Thermoproteus sp. AZ2 TaxID=1609232 RepID=A0ACC6V353_9CREN|nr:MAG: orotate phosphoribosyltransferase [Thermoproteus sp. AZ2]
MIQEFVAKEIIKFGEFKLSSGAKSPYYVDMRAVLAYPDLLRWVIAKYAELLKAIDFDIVVGVATGGIPYAAILGFSFFKPIAYVREEAKWYGTRKAIEGAMWQGARAVVIDDVVTTGESIISAIRKVKEAGGNVEAAVVFLDRQQCGAARIERETGVPVKAAYKILDLLKEIRDLIGPARYLEVYNYVTSFKC